MEIASGQQLAHEIRRVRTVVARLFVKPPYWARLRQLRKSAQKLPIDMYETSDHVVVKATIAGVRPEEVNISVTGNVLAIRTERKEKHEIRGAGAIKRERFCGPFERCLTLPAMVKVEKAQATLKNSELILRLPKIDQKTKYIKVQAARIPKDR